jgi:hypothetical protein
MSHHHVHHVAHIVEGLKHSTDPTEGAMGGAAISAIGIPAALATVGLALTPLGWAAALGAGALAGRAYVKRKLK